MLRLKKIVKDYDSAGQKVHALRGVSVAFRSSEFVAILGHSGCGKTTLLNIIGGLDRYTSGDLFIKGKSTRNYKSRDWDTYRNHSIGFVFQSYNLISHQSVLANVELALALSGVGAAERRHRATDALNQVGLGDQLHKKPNQLSGGQMQRVAIARALVNNPEILLADEPTGALDTETSRQVMEILKEIAKDRLVIMVTHNPELAAEYATRTIRLIDGEIIADTNPYNPDDESAFQDDKNKRRASMSALTAFSLSLSNLLSKKGRTILTAFAGSIGIVGIALILSLSTGINDYIASVQKDTLSSYPLTIQASTMDMTSMMTSMRPEVQENEVTDGKIRTANVMSSMIGTMIENSIKNDLTSFKAYLESGDSGIENLTTEIRYEYDTSFRIYREDAADGILQVHPATVFSAMGVKNGMGNRMDVFTQLTSNEDLLNSQYEILSGRMPQAWNEVVLIVDENNRITDYTLYAIGEQSIQPLREAVNQSMQGEKPQLDNEIKTYSFDDFLGMTFSLLPDSSLYTLSDGVWVDRSDDEVFLATSIADADKITIVGVVRPAEGSNSTSLGVIGYTRGMMDHLIEKVNNSEVVKAQLASPDIDIFTGLPFSDPDEAPTVYTLDEIRGMTATMPEAQRLEILSSMSQMQESGMPDDQIAAILSEKLDPAAKSTLEENLHILGVVDKDKPSAIHLYPVDFESKNDIADVIRRYNENLPEDERLTYTDYVGLMMSSVTTIISAISYILIAFVAISLVVSSIMISIITNISVLERTKEIGILRAVGASKRDISRVFNAETIIEGLAAGFVGIALTELFIIPINRMIHSVANINANAYLDPKAAVILIAISVFLTYIAGLIPARKAAKKDPVVALRTE